MQGQGSETEEMGEGEELVGGLGVRAHKDLVVNVNSISECDGQDSL